MILSDIQIRKRCTSSAYYPDGKPMISPFSEPVSGNGVISFGVTSAGYDIRLDRNGILIYNEHSGLVIDPKRFNDPEYVAKAFIKIDDADDFILPPHGYMLGNSMETFNIPRDITGLCVGKSTWARSALIVNTTPLESSWSGTLTIEISNPTKLPIRVYTGEGIAQLQFHRIYGEVGISYADKGGKYQNQKETTVAKVL